MTAPLTPPDLDLRDFSYMPLDVVRLRDAEITVVASGDAFRAAVLLWCAAWHQVPAASVPNNDRILAALAGFGRDLKGWQKVRQHALHGFILCSDDRLYHPVIAEKAIEADGKRKGQRRRTAAATAAAAEKKRNGHRNVIRNGPRNDDQENRRELNSDREARARDDLLLVEFAKVLGVGLDDPALFGVPHHLNSLLARGFTRETILAGTARAMSGKSVPPSWAYFAKCIETENAERSAPAKEELRHGKTGSVIAAADRLVERLAEFNRPAPDTGGPRAICGGEGAPPVRAIPER